MPKEPDDRLSFRDQLTVVVVDKGLLAIVALIAGCYVNQAVDHYKIAQESAADQHRTFAGRALANVA